MFVFPFITNVPTFDEWNLAAYRNLSSYWRGFSDGDNCGDLPTDYRPLNNLIYSVFSVIDEEFDVDFDDKVLMYTGDISPFIYDCCNKVSMSSNAKKQFNEKYGNDYHRWAVEMFDTLLDDYGNHGLMAKIQNGKFALWDDTYQCQDCKNYKYECSGLVNNDNETSCFECQHKAATVFQKIHRGNEVRWTNTKAVWIRNIKDY